MIDKDGNWTPDKPAQAKQENLMDKVMRYGVKNPNIGFSKLFRNVADTVPWVLNSALDLPSSAYNLGAKTLGSDSRINLGHQPGGGAAFPYTNITDEQISNYFGLPENEQGIADKLIQFAPDLIGSLIFPESKLAQRARATQVGGKAAPPIKKAIDKGIDVGLSQGTYGLAASPADSKGQGALMQSLLSAPFAGAGKFAQSTTSVPLRHAVGVAGGAGAGALGTQMGDEMGLPLYLSGPLGALMGAKTYKGISSPNAKLAAQFEGVDLTDPKVAERLEAAKRLGVNITPSEAAKDSYLGGVHAETGRSAQGSKQYYESLEGKIAQEEAAINKLNNLIYNAEEHKPIVDAGYAKVYTQEVPPTMGLKYSGNKSIEKATKAIENDAELMINAEKSGITTGTGASQKLDRTKLGYWDLMKRYFDREHKRVSSPDASSIDKLKQDTFDDLRKGITKELDPIFPEYEKVRSLSERKKARQTIEKAFDKYDVGGKRFDKAFESKEKFSELRNHLRDAPETQKMLDDMKLIFDESKKKPSISNVAGRKASGMDQDRNFKNATMSFIKKIIGDNKNDPEIIKVLYSGKWQEKMAEINKISDGQMKVGKFIEMLGEISAPAGRKALEKKPTSEAENKDIYEEWTPK